MGLRKLFEDAQKKAEDMLKKANTPPDPAEVKKQKKEDIAKNIRRTGTAMRWVKKGVDTYNTAAKKADELTKDVAEKTIELAEQVKPLADRVDQTASDLAEKAKGAIGTAIEKITPAKGVDSGDPKPPQPSTGSGLLDFLTPAVPETDATKPKKTDAPKPPKT